MPLTDHSAMPSAVPSAMAFEDPTEYLSPEHVTPRRAVGLLTLLRSIQAFDAGVVDETIVLPEPPEAPSASQIVDGRSLLMHAAHADHEGRHDQHTPTHFITRKDDLPCAAPSFEA